MMLCQIPACPRRARHGNYCRRHFESEVGPILPAVPRNDALEKRMREQNHENGNQT